MQLHMFQGSTKGKKLRSDVYWGCFSWHSHSKCTPYFSAEIKYQSPKSRQLQVNCAPQYGQQRQQVSQGEIVQADVVIAGNDVVANTCALHMVQRGLSVIMLHSPAQADIAEVEEQIEYSIVQLSERGRSVLRSVNIAPASDSRQPGLSLVHTPDDQYIQTQYSTEDCKYMTRGDIERAAFERVSAEQCINNIRILCYSKLDDFMCDSRKLKLYMDDTEQLITIHYGLLVIADGLNSVFRNAFQGSGTVPVEQTSARLAECRLFYNVPVNYSDLSTHIPFQQDTCLIHVSEQQGQQQIRQLCTLPDYTGSSGDQEHTGGMVKVSGDEEQSGGMVKVSGYCLLNMDQSGQIYTRPFSEYIREQLPQLPGSWADTLGSALDTCVPYTIGDCQWCQQVYLPGAVIIGEAATGLSIFSRTHINALLEDVQVLDNVVQDALQRKYDHTNTQQGTNAPRLTHGVNQNQMCNSSLVGVPQAYSKARLLDHQAIIKLEVARWHLSEMEPLRNVVSRDWLYWQWNVYLIYFSVAQRLFTSPGNDFVLVHEALQLESSMRYVNAWNTVTLNAWYVVVALSVIAEFMINKAIRQFSW